MTNLVIGTEVVRREDGCVLTLHFADGRVEERYLSPAEILELQEQLNRSVKAGEGR